MIYLLLICSSSKAFTEEPHQVGATGAGYTGDLANWLQILGFIATLYIGWGMRKILSDISEYRDNRQIKNRLNSILDDLDSKKPLKSDINDLVKSLLNHIEADYVNWYHFKRRNRLKDARKFTLLHRATEKHPTMQLKD